MEKEEEQVAECIECRRVLSLGVDAVSLTYGVIGPRGFVPLSDPRFACDEECLLRHLGSEETEKLPRRIP